MGRKYLKKLLDLIFIIGLAALLVGCGGSEGDDSSENIIDDTEIQNAISARVNLFTSAVEMYDVDEMLSFLNENSFNLTIAENDVEYKKDYSKLAAELGEGEVDQLNWRKSSEDGGYGYILTMEIGEIVYDNISSHGAFATVSFTIKEEADDISQIITDTGYMVCEMIGVQGDWYCENLTIVFNTGQLTSMSKDSMPISSDNIISGFGFGQMNF